MEKGGGGLGKVEWNGSLRGTTPRSRVGSGAGFGEGVKRQMSDSKGFL